MALLLQSITVVVQRSDFSRCQGLPAFLQALNPAGGILFETCWYDPYLWCETAMTAGDADAIVSTWEGRGLTQHEPRAARAAFRDICVAASGKGPLGACDWLDFDADENAVHLHGTDPGPIIGGCAQFKAQSRRLEGLEQEGEHAYEAMYESSHPKDDYDDARTALSGAVDIARFLHQERTARRLTERLEHIAAVYDSQFRRR